MLEFVCVSLALIDENDYRYELPTMLEEKILHLYILGYK